MDLEQLAAALQMYAASQHQKAVGSQHSAMLLQQPGGMFAVTGLNNDIISTHVAPHGLGAMIPALPSDVDDPRFGFITGFSDDIGSEPDFPCDDAPTGYMKAATLTAQFGRLSRQTETIEVDKLLHRKRGVNNNLRLLNSMLTGNVGMNLGNMNESDIMNLVVKAEMVSVGVRAERKLARMLWSGSAAVSSAHGGYKEFPGLDAQIATGQVDAENNVAVPSADSLIYNFAFQDVDGSVRDIVEYISMMEFQLRDLATRTNMDPVTFAIVMRRELWFELSAIWPCRYLTQRCVTSPGVTGMSININGSEQVAMRDAMRNGLYIDINGNRYPVVLDDGIHEYTNATHASVPAGFWASSLYFVPLRVRGNFPVLYWEHIDYTELQRQLAPLGAGMRNTPFWTDNGRWLWVYKENGYCFSLQVKTEPRVILRTPHLAGKIQNVRYSPMEHLRSPFPDSPYWKNGGSSFRPEDTDGFAVWS